MRRGSAFALWRAALQTRARADEAEPTARAGEWPPTLTERRPDQPAQKEGSVESGREMLPPLRLR